MREWFDNLRALFRDNPRLWIVFAGALLVGFASVWYAYGGFSFQIGRFFAVDIPGDTGGGGNETPTPTPTASDGGAGPGAERCPGRAADPPSWVPDSALAWLCDRDAGEDSDLDRQCVSWNETNKRGSGGEFGYKSRRYAEGQMSGGPAVQFPWYCVEFYDHCPEGSGNVWAVFGSGDAAVCKFSEATATIAPTATTTTTTLPAAGTVLIGSAAPGGGVYAFDNLKPGCFGAVTCPSQQPCGGTTGGSGSGSVAYNIRVGHAKYDITNNLIYSEHPVYVNDWTRWKWAEVPTSQQLWCNRTGTGTAWIEDHLVDAPAGGPGTIARCIDRTPGYVPLNCAKVVGGSQPGATVSPGATTGPTPAISAAPGEPVRCAPLNQTVRPRQIARLEASGGNGVYVWNVTQGGSMEEGGNQYIGVSYATTGRKTLRVSSSGSSSACVIDVALDATPTPTVIAQALVAQKTAKNTTTGDPTDRNAVTVFPGQTVQFKIRVTNNGSGALNNVRLTDTVPSGMSYVARSTRVENQSIPTESVTTTGLAVGRLNAGESVTIEWSAIANRTALIVSGPNLTMPMAQVVADAVPAAVAQMSVTVYGSGATTGAGGVPTGPGDTILAAFLAAAVLTLLYGGYTRSAAYRRHDAQSVSRDQGPMDFRS